MDDRTTRARGIQAAIGRILLEDWDPIGVQDVAEAQDEYDGYVGGVYRLLVSGASAREIAEHLCAIEAEQMGLSVATPESRFSVAEKLSRLNVRLEPH
jgi:hypothetical protein